jgi:hypothetical protein
VRHKTDPAALAMRHVSYLCVDDRRCRPERDKAYQDLTRMLAQQPLNVPICVAKALWIGSKKVIGMDQLSGTRSVFGTADTRLVSIAK